MGQTFRQMLEEIKLLHEESRNGAQYFTQEEHDETLREG